MLVEMGIHECILERGRKYLCREYWVLDTGSGKITFNGNSNKFISCEYEGMAHGTSTGKVWIPYFLFQLEGYRIQVSSYQLENHFKLDPDESVNLKTIDQLYKI
jgi:hypothetical protein